MAARPWIHSCLPSESSVFRWGDVVTNRNDFLAKMEECDKMSKTCDGNVPLLEGDRPHIWVVHDENTFHANCDQSFFWGNESTNVLHQKSLGAAIMVSDFVDKVSAMRPRKLVYTWRYKRMLLQQRSPVTTSEAYNRHIRRSPPKCTGTLSVW